MSQEAEIFVSIHLVNVLLDVIEYFCPYYLHKHGWDSQTDPVGLHLVGVPRACIYTLTWLGSSQNPAE